MKKQSKKQSTIRTGPGHHWDKLSPEERSAIGQKAAETRRRNAALSSGKANGKHDDALESIEVLESVALGKIAVSDAVKRSMVSAAASLLRGFFTKA